MLLIQLLLLLLLLFSASLLLLLICYSPQAIALYSDAAEVDVARSFLFKFFATSGRLSELALGSERKNFATRKKRRNTVAQIKKPVADLHSFGVAATEVVNIGASATPISRGDTSTTTNHQPVMHV